MAEKQVRSRQRVADHGEVFTAEREVNAMLDLVKNETERIESRFLEMIMQSLIQGYEKLKGTPLQGKFYAGDCPAIFIWTIMTKPLTRKQIADYEQLCRDKNNGRLLTLDGLRLICEVYNYAPEAIGRHFLEVLAKIGQR